MPVVNPMNALSEGARQQAYQRLASLWGAVDQASLAAMQTWYSGQSSPYDAYISLPNYSNTGDPYQIEGSTLRPSGDWGEIPVDLKGLDFLYSPETAYNEGSLNWEPTGAYKYNYDLAPLIGGDTRSGVSFLPLSYIERNVGHYKSIDPNFDLSQLKTTMHPIFGPVALTLDLPQTDQTTGEMLAEMAQAAAIVGAGAMGISGFAGLHGLPGIDSLFSGFSNLFGGGTGGGTSGAGGAASAVDPWLGSASTWTPEAIQGYLSGAPGGMLSSLGGGSSNPIEALTQALQGQVDAGVITPSQMSSALQSASTTGSTGSSWLDSLLGNSSGGGLMSGSGGWNSILSGGLQALGGLLTGNQATDAAESQADAYLQAAKIAADAAKFKPVGVTTRFGSSNFGYDANGNLTNAGYQLSPDIKAQQTSLMGGSDAALQQYLAAQGATAPMGQTAQTLFGLGQGYLGTSPQDQAAQYMAEQQALLAPTRERDFASLENRLRAQGRLGLATGATSTGLGAANPELESFYNAQRMQDLNLAAQATQGGMDYAKFGAGLVGTGGDMLKSMYGTQTAAYDPYKTMIGGASMLEGLGQNAMDLGINIGAKGTAANAQSGMLMSQGMTNAANAMAPANAYSPWGSLLSGAGTMLGNYGGQQQQNQQYKFDPFTGQQIRWN